MGSLMGVLFIGGVMFLISYILLFEPQQTANSFCSSLGGEYDEMHSNGVQCMFGYSENAANWTVNKYSWDIVRRKSP